MKQLLKMPAAPATELFALAFVAMATPAAAGPGEGCRQDVPSGMRSRRLATLEPCQALAPARGGTCYRDPLLTDPSSAYAYHPKHPLPKSVILHAKKPV